MLLEVGKLHYNDPDLPKNLNSVSNKVFIRKVGSEYRIDVGSIPTINPPAPSKDLTKQIQTAKNFIKKNGGTSYSKIKICSTMSYSPGVKILDLDLVNPEVNVAKKKN